MGDKNVPNFDKVPEMFGDLFTFLYMHGIDTPTSSVIRSVNYTLDLKPKNTSELREIIRSNLIDPLHDKSFDEAFDQWMRNESVDLEKKVDDEKVNKILDELEMDERKTEKILERFETLDEIGKVEEDIEKDKPIADVFSGVTEEMHGGTEITGSVKDGPKRPVTGDKKEKGESNGESNGEKNGKRNGESDGDGELPVIDSDESKKPSGGGNSFSFVSLEGKGEKEGGKGKGVKGFENKGRSSLFLSSALREKLFTSEGNIDLDSLERVFDDLEKSIDSKRWGLEYEKMENVRNKLLDVRDGDREERTKELIEHVKRVFRTLPKKGRKKKKKKINLRKTLRSSRRTMGIPINLERERKKLDRQRNCVILFDGSGSMFDTGKILMDAMMQKESFGKCRAYLFGNRMVRAGDVAKEWRHRDYYTDFYDAWDDMGKKEIIRPGDTVLVVSDFAHYGGEEDRRDEAKVFMDKGGKNARKIIAVSLYDDEYENPGYGGDIFADVTNAYFVEVGDELELVDELAKIGRRQLI